MKSRLDSSSRGEPILCDLRASAPALPERGLGLWFAWRGSVAGSRDAGRGKRPGVSSGCEAHVSSSCEVDSPSREVDAGAALVPGRRGAVAGQAGAGAHSRGDQGDRRGAHAAWSERSSPPPPPPLPPSRTNWTRLVPPSVLTGHVSAAPPYPTAPRPRASSFRIGACANRGAARRGPPTLALGAGAVSGPARRIGPGGVAWRGTGARGRGGGRGGADAAGCRGLGRQLRLRRCASAQPALGARAWAGAPSSRAVGARPRASRVGCRGVLGST